MAPKAPPSTAGKPLPGRNNVCPAAEFLDLQFAATKPRRRGRRALFGDDPAFRRVFVIFADEIVTAGPCRQDFRKSSLGFNGSFVRIGAGRYR
jgi:hypothetical protein